MPPLPTGARVRRIVSFTAVVAGDVTSFDASTYTQQLAGHLGISDTDIVLVVSPASLRVEARITPTTATSLVTIASALNILAASPSQAGTVLGVTVVRVEAPLTITDMILAPSQPPLSAPSNSAPTTSPLNPTMAPLATSSSAQTVGDGSSDAVVLGLGIGLAACGVLALVCGFFIIRWAVQRKRTSTIVRAVPITATSTVDAIAASSAVATGVEMYDAEAQKVEPEMDETKI